MRIQDMFAKGIDLLRNNSLFFRLFDPDASYVLLHNQTPTILFYQRITNDMPCILYSAERVLKPFHNEAWTV